MSAKRRNKNKKTVAPQGHAAKESGLGPRVDSIPTETEPTIHADYDSCCCKYNPPPAWKHWLEGIALMAGIGYAIITFFLWSDAKDNFIKDHRPWVGVKGPIEIRKITFDPSKPLATYSVILKNYGPSLALKVAVISYPIMDANNVTAKIEQSCREAGNESEGHLPQTPPTLQGGFGSIEYPSEESTHWFKEVPLSQNPGNFILIVGCIVYRDQFGEQRHTRFAYSNPDPAFVDIRSGLPLSLYQYYGANSAD